MPSDEKASAASPVTDEGGDGGRTPEAGVALCLSGGGYRAMLFHVGAVWRLNELGFLPKLARVSSVSGGSITAATLGRNWPRLDFDEADVARMLVPQFVAPLRGLASQTIDRGSVLGGILTPGKTIGDKVAAAYRKHLFGTDTLRNLPEQPRFVINATNVQTGSLWRFSRKYMADYRIGLYAGARTMLRSPEAAAWRILPPLQRRGIHAPSACCSLRRPIRAGECRTYDDNALVLLGEGLPYRIDVVAQNDDLLELHDGSRVRIEPCVTEDRTA